MNADNIKFLDDRGFSFICPQGCKEKFEFTFKTGTAENSFEGVDHVQAGTTHHFIVGIADCETGEDVVDKMFDYIVELFGPSQGFSPGDTSLKVAHDNVLEKTGSASFVVYSPLGNSTTPEGARTRYKNLHDNGSVDGSVDCSSFNDEVTDEDRTLWIQCGADSDDGMYLTINRVNGRTVGVRDLDVTTGPKARSAIDTVKNGIKYINTERASLGAQQNRLEHTYKNVTNVEENTTAAESRIRDTDMAREMVKYSNNNILAQAGQAMLAQANQTNQGVLALLQ